MAKKRLFFDMDNVLVNFQSGIDQLDEATKQEYEGRLDEVPGIFALMKPVDGAIEAVKKLAEVYDVFILSTAPWNNPSAWSDKVEWVKKYFDSEDSNPTKNPFHKRMVITHRKDLCEGDYLIDDRGKNGTSEFKGEWIQFGSEKFPNWDSIVNYLNARNSNTEKWWRYNRNTISWIALGVVFVGEFFAFMGIHDNWCVWGPWTLISVGLVIALWCFGRLLKHKFSIRSVILTKLLANAIAPQRLGTLYLLYFVVHIGWLTNAAMSLFMPNDLKHVLVSCFVCLVGMLVLIIFFPNGNREKVKNATKVFVSGISFISVPYTKQYQDLNLRPLVRILKETNDDIMNCEMLVLKSDFDGASDETISNKIKEVLEFMYLQTLDDKENNYLDCILKKIDQGMTINQQLALLIREVAKKEFPQKKWIDSLRIEFTDACNYNEFDQCFSALDCKLQDKDNTLYQLVFNITPGTGIVGSLMTLMAIDGDRSLFYYNQDKRVLDNGRIKTVNKSKVPLENLLSQALETITDNK
ncbi:MAG: hypothetical protein J5952_06425 [Prevotella sp.]|nr:hypothetical protein [Prevotella sp.]